MNISQFIGKTLHFFNLEAELENQDFVFEEIKKGIVFKGTNLWILIFAIIIASVGLNMNSTAVIIGAMLISPLMGPINGMGYSIATYDFDLFRKALKNFSFAILAGLITSTLYFFVSPVSTAHSEILARTSPTIYDVIIALFGGFAGIVAISSRQKGNVIPGVAIATALMPPLCTAGYGLATWQFNYFFGAFYLFTINTIFIAIASVWISQLLKFPIRTIVDEVKKKKINRAITVVITIVLLPSIFFGYKLVKQEEFLQKAKQYVSNISIFEGNYLLKHEIDAKSNVIRLVYGGSTLNEYQKEAIVKKSDDFNIKDASITIEQGLTLASTDERNVEVYKLKEEVINLKTSLNNKNKELDSIHTRQQFGRILYQELKVIFPQVQSCIYAETQGDKDNENTEAAISIVIIRTNSALKGEDRKKINNWLIQRLNRKDVKIFYE